jgi:hypothetical protein
VGCKSNGKVWFVQTDWPGETNDLTAFMKQLCFICLSQRIQQNGWIL